MVEWFKFQTHVYSNQKSNSILDFQPEEVSQKIGHSYPWGKLLYTLPGKENHTETLLKLISIAVEKDLPLFIASFVVGYEAIVNPLIKATKKLRGKIFLITALDRNEVRKTIFDLPISSSVQETHFSVLERLSKAGIRIRNYNDGHWKLILVGDEIGFFTSANLTKEAYTGNPELGIIVKEKETLKSLRKLFGLIWFDYCTMELRENEGIGLPAARAGGLQKRP